MATCIKHQESNGKIEQNQFNGQNSGCNFFFFKLVTESKLKHFQWKWTTSLVNEDDISNEDDIKIK